MYKIQKQKDLLEKDVFEVVEIASDNILKTFYDHTEANSFYRKLKETGIGFEGWTPAFVLTEVPV